MSQQLFRRVFALMTIVAALLIVGTCGYVLIEDWTLMDGFFMTVITLSTVGYGEAQELSEWGRVFTSVLIVICMTCMACWTAGITSLVVSGEVTGAFQKQKEQKMITEMKDHIIVCGGGILARTIIASLRRREKQCVAIVGNDTELQLLRRLYPDLPIVEGDPKSEMSLADANALSAAYLVAAVESDFDNLLITITGKGLGTGIRVIACSQNTELSSRMLNVGADQVICPLVLGGEEAAKLVA